MKLYITGPVGSGKTTLARQLSQKPGSPASTWTRWPMSRTRTVGGNRKRPEEERDAMFRSILEQEDYILEDTGRACFIAGMEQADRVVLLEPLLCCGGNGWWPAGCARTWAWRPAPTAPPLPCCAACSAGAGSMRTAGTGCGRGRPSFRKSSSCSAAKKTSGAGCGAWNTDWEKGGPPCHPCLKMDIQKLKGVGGKAEEALREAGRPHRGGPAAALPPGL